jgi:hypothetical protein
MTVIKASTRFLFFELAVLVQIVAGGMIGWASSRIQLFLKHNFRIPLLPI